MRITLSVKRDAPGKFTGRIGDRTIVSRTQMPFCDAARVLIAEGVDPSTTYVMRHEGQDYDALTSTVGVAAGLIVKEGPHGPGFRKFRTGE